MISNQNRRLSITPQGQLIPSPTGNLTLYVDLEIAEERAAKLEAKLVEARNRVHELEAKLEAATNVIIDLTPYPTTEEADEILRAAGFDPAAVGEHGRQLAERALKAIRPQAPTDPQ